MCKNLLRTPYINLKVMGTHLSEQSIFKATQMINIRVNLRMQRSSDAFGSNGNCSDPGQFPNPSLKYKKINTKKIYYIFAEKFSSENFLYPITQDDC